MAVIKDYYDGPTHIIIHDDFVVDPAEVPAILERVGTNAYRAINAALNAKQKAGESPEEATA